MNDAGHRNLFASIQDTSPPAPRSALQWILFVILVSTAMGAWFL